MMDNLKPMKNVRQMIRALIREEITATKTLDVYVVTGVDVSNFRVNIKRMNSSETYDDVEMIGIGFGNIKGLMKLPSVNDLVLVGFVANSETPIILGSLFDIYSTTKDARVDVHENELFVNAQTEGAYFYIDKDNNIIISTKTGAKIKLLESGGFKLFDKNNYGIESDGNGSITFHHTEFHFNTGSGTF